MQINAKVAIDALKDVETLLNSLLEKLEKVETAFKKSPLIKNINKGIDNAVVAQKRLNQASKEYNKIQNVSEKQRRKIAFWQEKFRREKFSQGYSKDDVKKLIAAETWTSRAEKRREAGRVKSSLSDKVRSSKLEERILQ